MSLYNNSVVTRLVDPVYSKENFRSEFRLQNDTVYLSNLRLLNSGLKGSPSSNTRYNYLLGAYPIESIQLYSGNVLLDQIQSASLYQAFKNARHTNDKNISVNSYLKKNHLGYLACGNQAYDNTDNSYPVEGTEGITYADSTRVNIQNNIPTILSTDGEGRDSWISLRETLPFLSSAIALPTRVLKDLRLVVNWKSDAKNLVTEQNNTGFTTNEDCVLVVDEVNPGQMFDNLNANTQTIVWNPVEHDSAYVEAVTSGTQTKTVTFNGFDNKKLLKLLLVKTPTDESTWTGTGNRTFPFSNQGSLAFWDERFQIVVNGSAKLPFDGWTRPNQRLAHLTDSYGQVNVVYGQQVTNTEQNGVLVAGHLQDTHGMLSYTGCVVDEPNVQELVVTVQRSHLSAGSSGNTKNNQAYRMNLFGITEKALMFNQDGTFRIVYT